MSKPKTIKVKIALVVDEDSNWSANGFGEAGGNNTTDVMDTAIDCCPGESTCFQKYWVTVQVAKPAEITVAGTVKPAGGTDAR